MKLRANDAVPVLARMRAAVFAHDGERLLGNRAQFANVLVPFDVQHRPDV